MKFLVFCYNTQNGLLEATRGEGRYMLNMAEQLALRGHEVTLCGHHLCQWGRQPPVGNITLRTAGNLNKSEYFDVSISPIEFCGGLGLNTKVQMHIWFGNGYIPHEVSCNKAGHVIVHPLLNLFRSTDSESVRKEAMAREAYSLQDGFKHYRLSYPCYYSTPTLPDVNRNRHVIWYSKDYYTSLPNEPTEKQGLSVLSALKKLSEKRGAKCIFLHSRCLNSPRAISLGAQNIHRSISNREDIDDVVSYDQSRRLFSTCRISPILTGIVGGCFDLISEGCLPIQNDDGVGSAAWMSGYNYPRMNINMSESEVFELIDAAYSDDLLWEKAILGCQRDTSFLSGDFFYDDLKFILLDSFGIVVQ